MDRISTSTCHHLWGQPSTLRIEHRHILITALLYRDSSLAGFALSLLGGLAEAW
ncbi:hypothetical protein PFI31113_00955 [Pandoraea fibrosis]|uniref:Uncharacterized protein n=1 Tax=Pandoraea fibrosis TaxID=1891094 RepID=A0A5E4SS30_9BURK|nr:hypothetical protein PFI31113_00955 [Pandoraea fibrosis]